MSTSYGAPHYVTLSILLLLSTRQFQIFFSVTCSSHNVRGQVTHTHAYTHRRVGDKLYFCKSLCYQIADGKNSESYGSKHSLNFMFSNFIMKEVLICYYHSKMYKLCHIFAKIIYILILSYILVTQHKYILTFHSVYLTNPLTVI